jgi:Zn finger protein HypA/HybF involved in hydrogenase expression
MDVTALNRTLDQELMALMRGVSLECLVCGEFVVHVGQDGRFCPECGSGLEAPAVAGAALATKEQRGG